MILLSFPNLRSVIRARFLKNDQLDLELLGFLRLRSCFQVFHGFQKSELWAHLYLVRQRNDVWNKPKLTLWENKPRVNLDFFYPFHFVYFYTNTELFMKHINQFRYLGFIMRHDNLACRFFLFFKQPVFLKLFFSNFFHD